MTLSVAEEQVLVARAGSGDRRAFEALICEHADCVYSVLLRFCAGEEHAREVTCASFLRAWHQICTGGPTAAILTMLCELGIEEAHRTAAAHDGTTRAANHLEDAIRTLPRDERIALVLHDVEGWSTERAAGALGVRPAALARRLRRARTRIRGLLGDELAAPA